VPVLATPAGATPAQPDRVAGGLLTYLELQRDLARKEQRLEEVRGRARTLRWQVAATEHELRRLRGEKRRFQQQLTELVAGLYMMSHRQRHAASLAAGGGPAAEPGKVLRARYREMAAGIVGEKSLRVLEAYEKADREVKQRQRALRETLQELADTERKLEVETGRLRELERDLARDVRAQLLSQFALGTEEDTEVDPSSIAGWLAGPDADPGLRAVKFAVQQLGEPYVFGSAGPDTWDCSGLVKQAWAYAAGVRLIHFAATQQAQTLPVPETMVRPGDLVFFGNPAGHVGIVVAPGFMIHAPRTGDRVKISSYRRQTLSGFGRVLVTSPA